MPLYMFRGGYTGGSWATQIQKPVNREEALKPSVRQLGGRIISFYYAFGEDDFVVIAQMPDNKAAAALALAAASSGSFTHLTTTPLMTVTEGMSAMRQAKRSRYSPPGA
jgi:uncharacterized protein with GYD domain